jgi:hypothetical protein
MRFVLNLASGFLASLTFAQAKNLAAVTPMHIELPSRYENVARAARLQGVVTVMLTVSGDGKVIAAEASSPNPELKAHPILLITPICTHCRRPTEPPVSRAYSCWRIRSVP